MGFRSVGHRQGATILLFGGSFALARPLAGFPGVPLTPFGVSPGALWVRSLCFFRVFWRSLDVGPVSFCAICGGARCTIRTRLPMFCKGSSNQKRATFQTLLGHPDTHKREQKRSGRAGEGARVAPETPDSYQNGAQAPCRESVRTKNGNVKNSKEISPQREQC